MTVYGVSQYVMDFIKEQANFSSVAQQALMELQRTNNGGEPQLATFNGELCVHDMMLAHEAKAPEVYKEAPKPAPIPDIPFLVGQDEKIKQLYVEAYTPDPIMEKAIDNLAKKTPDYEVTDQQVLGEISKEAPLSQSVVGEPPFLVPGTEGLVPENLGEISREAVTESNQYFPWLAAGVILFLAVK